MAFTYKILTQNGVDNTNIDGARAEYFAAGMRDGIIKGSLNECAFTAIPSNGINLDTGVLLVAGHPIVITEGRSWTFTSRPSNSERRAVIAEITVDNNRSVAFRVFEQLASIALVKNNMYEHENGSGTYQVEIGRFTLKTSGLVEDVERTLDLITGGSSGMGEHFIAGNITTTMLDAGMDANVTAEDIYDANGDYKQTDFSFELPETAGTVITVNDVEQENLSFKSDPQTQIDNKVDKSDIDSALSNTSENPVQNKKVKEALDNKANISDLLPVGSIISFAGKVVPTGWLWCNGDTFNQNDYPTLYAVLGNSDTLPNLNGRFLEGTNTVNDIGTTVSAGLPNITGSFTANRLSIYEDNSAVLSGAFNNGIGQNTGSGQSGADFDNTRHPIIFNFNASKSNTIYGGSTTVQPNSYKVMYIIKAE